MTDLEKLQSAALAKIDRAERHFQLAFWGAVIFESLFTLGILYFVDFRNTLHMLIVCCTGVIYMPIILGLVALGAHVSRNTLRVLARLDDEKGR
jgi:hypothetical protein